MMQQCSSYLLYVALVFPQSYLAVFNLIPIWNLDGSKVLRWNILVWIVIIAIAGFMTYLSMTMGAENIIRMIIGIK